MPTRQKSEVRAYRRAPLRALGKVLARSALNPLHIGVAAGSAGAGWLSGLWPLVALGGATFAALVAWDIASPEFWKKVLDSQTFEAVQDFPLDSIQDPSLRQLCAEVLRARVELAQLAEAHPDVAELLGSVLSGAERLQSRAQAVAERADQLARYLERTDVSAIHRELEELRARARRTASVETRDQYTHIISTREQQLVAIGDISAGLERAHAQLLRIRATYEGLSARILRLSTLDADARGEVTGGMNAELEDVHRDLEAFEEVLRDLQPVGANA